MIAADGVGSGGEMFEAGVEPWVFADEAPATAVIISSGQQSEASKLLLMR